MDLFQEKIRMTERLYYNMEGVST